MKPTRIEALQCARTFSDGTQALHPCDQVDHGTPEEYAILRPILDQMLVPWWPIPSNHDGAAFWSVFSDRMPKDFCDVSYVIEYAGVRFILLDTSVSGSPYGDLNEERLEWLGNVLPYDGPWTLLEDQR